MQHLLMVDWLEQHLIPCFIKNHFGFDCPGCGLQRAVIYLLKGDLITSVQSYPALIPLILCSIVLLIQIKIKHPKGGTVLKWMFISTLVITIVNFGSKFL